MVDDQQQRARDVIRARSGPDTPGRVVRTAHILGCQVGEDGERFCPTHSPEDLGDEPLTYIPVEAAL